MSAKAATTTHVFHSPRWPAAAAAAATKTAYSCDFLWTTAADEEAPLRAALAAASTTVSEEPTVQKGQLDLGHWILSIALTIVFLIFAFVILVSVFFLSVYVWLMN